ncbi:MAG: DUF4291 domain-containing protein [Ferruginibacter sp.]|nr:DUF4291 domain-containing protein [Cytophagales bacterium]
MTLKTEPYLLQRERLPPGSGSCIIAQYDDEWVVVYQAYKPSIAAWATQNGRLGGDDFSFNRMSWIKPNFLWMMFRSGWATKKDQESILAIRIARKNFECLLREAVHSSFIPAIYGDQETWKRALASSEVRLQWDPDHDPFGHPTERRAIQVGLKGSLLRSFATDWIVDVQDITPFVASQKKLLVSGQLPALQVPVEAVYPMQDQELRRAIGINYP